MNVSANGIGWFEIGTDDPAAAERFYGEVLGWSFADDPDSGELPYRIVTTPAQESIQGGILGTGGQMPNYAVFCVVVDDVADTLRRAETAGGKVLVPATTAPNGLVFAQLQDPAGNQLGVFTPPTSSDT